MRQYTEQDADKAIDGYVIYLRKSREDIDAEKRGEGETLARHKRILLNLVEEQGLNVVECYEEIVSGETIQDRPLMTKMMKEVYAGKYKGVICVKPDRLSRGDLENMGYIMNGLKFSGTLLVTPGMTYDVLNNKYHEQMLEMHLFNSKQEYRAIVSRMQEGKILSIREGNYMSGRAPYGYDISKPDRWTRTLVPNENAQVVIQIFEWFVNDKLTSGEIARKLTARGIPSSKGFPEWSAASVWCILKNEVYAGKIKWFRNKTTRKLDENGVVAKKKSRCLSKKYLVVPGKHLAIISEEMFEAAQGLFAGKVPTKANTTVSNPFAGLLYCAKCGKRIIYKKEKSEKKLTRFCHIPTTLCKAKSIVETDLLEIFCNALREYISDFQFKLDNADKMEEAKKHAAEIERMEKELEKAKAKRRRLFDDYDEGVYTAAEFKERKAVWAERIDQMTFDLDLMKECKPEEIDYQEKVVKFSQVLEAFQDPSVSAREKNNLAKEIIERITYEQVGGGYGKLGNVTLDIHLKN